jgi:hypothetical protein
MESGPPGTRREHNSVGAVATNGADTVVHCETIFPMAGYNTAMKELVRKPLLLAMLLSLPLWIVFNNYVVSLIVSLLLAFLISMCHSLYVIERARKSGQHKQASPPKTKRRD